MSQIKKTSTDNFYFTVTYRNKMVTMFQELYPEDYTVLFNNLDQ